MAEDEQAPPDIDIRTPNMARMYDYALGGKDNFASDRSRDEIQRYFDGLDLVEPGLAIVTRWREESPDAELDAAGAWTLGGVGRKS